MIPIEFPESNVKIAEHQDEFITLPAYHNPEEGSMTCCLELNKEEIDRIVQTGKLYFKQITGNGPFQPIMLSTLKEDLIPQ